MMRYDDTEMRRVLDECGESYRYPVYCSVGIIDNFFLRGRPMQAYAAVSDTYLYIVSYSTLGVFSGEGKMFRIPLAGINRLTVRRMLLMHGYNIDIKARADGKSIRLKLNISAAFLGTADKFPEQNVNVDALTDELNRYSTE